MPVRHLIHVPRWAIKLGMFLSILLVIAFFALTRTEVGRDVIRSQIEREFSERYNGSLSIGKLSGNLTFRLYATDVVLRDSTGMAVATIDSIVAYPRWRRVIAGGLHFRRLYLFHTRLNAYQDSAGTWTVDATLGSRNPPDSAGTGLPNIDIGDLRLVDLVAVFTGDGPSPDLVSKGFLFDYRNSVYSIDELRAHLSWSADGGQVDLLRLSGDISRAGVRIEHFQGQLIVDDRGVLVNEASLATTESQVQLRAAMLKPDPDLSSEPQFELDMTADELSNDEARRLIPSYPLHDRLGIVARARGSMSSVVVEELSFRHGQSSIAVSGTVLGAPDSLDFDLALLDGRVLRRDLVRVVPDVRTSGVSADTLRLDLTARGVAHLASDRSIERAQATATYDLEGDFGVIDGQIAVSRRPEETWSYEVETALAVVDLSRIRQGLPVSRLTGDVTVSGFGTAFRTMSVRSEIRLIDSIVSDRHADDFLVSARTEDASITGFIRYAEGLGTFTVRGLARFQDENNPDYSVSAVASRLDAGPILGQDSILTVINARADVRAAGRSLRDVVGSIAVDFDTSEVFVRGRQGVIKPFSERITLERTDFGESVLKMTGGLIEGTATTNTRVAGIAQIAETWIAGLSGSDSIAVSSPTPHRSFDRGRGVLEPSPPSTVQAAAPHAPTVGDGFLRMDLRMTGSDILFAFFPRMTPTLTDARLGVDASFSSRRLALSASLTADSLQYGDLFTRAHTARLFFAGDLADTLVQELEVESFAQSLRFGGLDLPEASADLKYSRGAGVFDLATSQGATVGPIGIGGGIRHEPGEITLIPQTLALNARGYRWAASKTNPVVIRDGRIRLRGIEIENRGESGELVQSLAVSGVLSSQPGDTLFVETRSFDLAQLSDLLSLKKTIGGLTDARFAVTRSGRTPLVAGSASVTSFSLGNQMLGDLDIRTEFVPGAAEVSLGIALRPAAHQPYLDGLTVVDNDLDITGLIRLPASNSDGVRVDPGLLDLDALIRRADLFFLAEYVFSGTIDDVTGFASGVATITGSLGRPVFDAQLAFNEGRFTVPRFNLAMSVEGQVDVNQDAIAIRGLTLTDATGGTAYVTGDVLFNEYAFFSLDLQGSLSELQIMNVANSRELPFYGFLWASGDLTLSGPLYAARLSSPNAVTSPESQLYIPVGSESEASDQGFIIFADSSGNIPDMKTFTRRRNVLAGRAAGERAFIDGLDLDLNLTAPTGSTVKLVIDPLLGDIITGVGDGRVQIVRTGGEFSTFGQFEVDSGDYLFTAGEVFVRRFIIEGGGVISWTGDPIDAVLDIPAAYRTRASLAGLNIDTGLAPESLVPLIVNLRIGGRVSAPTVDLSLSIDRSQQSQRGSYDVLEPILNNPEKASEYATSVLLSNTFLLTTDSAPSSSAFTSSAFNSVSQLVVNQLNRFLGSALPNVDFSLGVQGESAQELDVTYGVALRLLDERLVIRGEGVYQGTRSAVTANAAGQYMQGAFTVEIRLNDAVSVAVFYRREGDVITAESVPTNTTGAGLTYKTEFPTWRRFFRQIFGWLIGGGDESGATAEPVAVGSGA